MRALIWVGLFVVAALGGCKCNDGTTIPVDEGDSGVGCTSGAQACTTNDQCGERSVCHKDKTTGESCCVETYRNCTGDVDCCPGQVCTADGHCVDKFDECTTATDCGDTPDRVCSQWTDPLLGASMRCTYAPCDDKGGCPSGQYCFAHFCVINPPCAGSCPDGTACVPQAAGGGRCHPFGQHCSLAPKPGYLVVFTDPNNVYDVCQLSKEACEYAELPPLAPIDLGRHPSVAVAGSDIVVAQYDGFYGDLVVQDFDATGTLVTSVWVDGVPATGTLTGGPSGPRGGISDPGDDVGKYTSTVAGSDGTVYVSYYDQTNGDLRFAERTVGSNAWSTHKVDGDAADVGLYTSLALDADGKPAVAYFQRAGSDDPSVSCATEPAAPKALITGVKLARAKTAHPRSAADWTVQMVSCASRPPPPCFGCTVAGATICVQDSTSKSGTSCVASASGCTTACPTGQACVAGNKCVAKGSSTELLDVPAGRGLFPSLAFKAANPAIAFYDHNGGNLIATQFNGTAWTEVIVDGEDASGDTGNVGLFPSLAVDATSGNFLLAYHDFTRRGLRFYSAATFAPVAKQLTPDPKSFIDTGVSDPKGDGPAWVGANASLALSPKGTYVAYQNSTAADLRLAHRATDGTWTQDKAWTDGAMGFFAHAVPTADGVIIVHTKIHAKIAGGKPVPDNSLQLVIFKP